MKLIVRRRGILAKMDKQDKEIVRLMVELAAANEM